jgi:hypothetical protein
MTDEQTPDDGQIAYNDAVREGKELVHRLDSECDRLRLGELAHRVKPVYGEGTLKRFADAIGIAKCTLERYRTVYRAWADILAPGLELGYAVARALAKVPNRAEIVTSNPEITKRKAEELARQHRGDDEQDHDEGDEDEDEEEQERETQARWAGRMLVAVNKAADAARIEDWTRFEADAGLRHAVEATFNVWRKLHEYLQQRLAGPSLH